MIIKPVSQHQILSIHDDQPVLSIEERHGIWLKKRKRLQESNDITDGQGVGLVSLYQQHYVKPTNLVLDSRGGQGIIAEVSISQHSPVKGSMKWANTARPALDERDFHRVMTVSKEKLAATEIVAHAATVDASKRPREGSAATEQRQYPEAVQGKRIVDKHRANPLILGAQRTPPLAGNSADNALIMSYIKKITDITSPPITHPKVNGVVSDSGSTTLLDSGVLPKSEGNEQLELDTFSQTKEVVAVKQVLITHHELPMPQRVVQAIIGDERSAAREKIKDKNNSLATDRVHTEGTTNLRDNSRAEMTWHFKSWTDNANHTAKLIFPDSLSMGTNVNIVPSDETVRNALVKQQNSDGVSGIRIDIAISQEQGREHSNHSGQHSEEEESEK
ncbi:hypothetical protein JGC56_09655 [Salmonella enterica subsp. enterica serovar Saintpaul]|nr:hypothetical protein [Salmonella enterica subsp. enterica serovar Saintpaul]